MQAVAQCAYFIQYQVSGRQALHLLDKSEAVPLG